MQGLNELNEAELEQIERRAAAATVGPWYAYVAGRDAGTDQSCIELGWCNEVGTFKSIELSGADAPDCDFIAHARQDIPRLLREIRRLRARLRASHGVADELGSQAVHKSVDRQQAQLRTQQ